MTQRRTLLCPGSRLVCPACRGAVPLCDVRDGYGFAICAHKVGRFERKRNCGQLLYWACDHRLCTVVTVTREEYDRLQVGHPTRQDIEAELGITTQDAAA